MMFTTLRSYKNNQQDCHSQSTSIIWSIQFHWKLQNHFLVINYKPQSLSYILIPSMYGIFTYIWLKSTVNVGKHTIHGSHGHWKVLENEISYMLIGHPCLNTKCWPRNFNWASEHLFQSLSTVLQTLGVLQSTTWVVSLKRKSGLFAGAVPNFETHPRLDTYICFKKWLHVKDVNVHVFCTWSIFQINGHVVIEDFHPTWTTVVDGRNPAPPACKKNLVKILGVNYIRSTG